MGPRAVLLTTPLTFWERLIGILQVANAFPHLESVVSGSLACLDVVWVSHGRLFGLLLSSELGYRKPQPTIQPTLSSRIW